MLQTQGLTYQYPGTKIDLPAIHLKAGETCLIHGLSGTGKSTYLHVLAGILRSDEGQYQLNDIAVNQLETSALEKWRKTHVGLVLQYPVFPKDLRCVELIELKLKWSQSASNVNINEAFQSLSLDHLKHKFPHQLSGGERQRLALLLASIHQPQLLLVDEATSHLDDERAEQLLQTIDQLRQADSMVVFVSHDQRIRSYFKQEVGL